MRAVIQLDQVIDLGTPALRARPKFSDAMTSKPAVSGHPSEQPTSARAKVTDQVAVVPLSQAELLRALYVPAQSETSYTVQVDRFSQFKRLCSALT